MTYPKLLIQREKWCKRKAENIIDAIQNVEQEKFHKFHFEIYIMLDLNDTDIFSKSFKISEIGKLSELVLWINKNLLQQIRKDNYITRNVKIRIATGMLNNLEKEKIITHDLNVYYHDNLVNNLFNLDKAIILEDLPF